MIELALSSHKGEKLTPENYRKGMNVKCVGISSDSRCAVGKVGVLDGASYSSRPYVKFPLPVGGWYTDACVLEVWEDD